MSAERAPVEAITNESMTMRHFALLVALSLVSACSSNRSYVAGPAVAAPDQEMAKAHCRIEASQNHGGPGSFFPIAEAIYNDGIADDCMLARAGTTRTEWAC